ncbi:hypothetical protein WN67_08210 [Mycolicibacterium obuense]|uniref:Methyltransferase type 11 domain-containing protein n=1 Tax=Mycolicibacterium obuense TaxID=1807 RepID=A0A0M2K5P0_9MYCO|nr:hypothetical protein WN67_08210 [Mycolicibacterium obuense]
MAVLTLNDLIEQNLLICPVCSSPLIKQEDRWLCSSVACRHSSQPFLSIDQMPVFVNFENSILEQGKLIATRGSSEVRRSRLQRARSRLVNRRNAVAERAVSTMERMLLEDWAQVRRPRILIVGGGTMGSGLEGLYQNSAVDLLGFDVYVSPLVQFVADGHSIPLADGSMDGVVVQAVLEHVLDPAVVVAEIYRVLRDGGIVYSDTPFMQQVHEGPYDFTRFTESGHRYLFKRFRRIDSGVVAGPGSSLLWSIRYFVRALTRSMRAGEIVGLAFFWLVHLDRLVDARHSIDGANSVFFLGLKHQHLLGETDIVEHYLGGLA